MEEKEKEECTGRDRCGAHAHSVTLSERVSLAHTQAGSSGRAHSERRGKVETALAPDFLRWQVHPICLLSNLRNPVLAARDLENAGHRDCPQPRQQ